MTFTMTFNDGDFLEQIENIKRDESLCLITNKEKAFISKEKLEEKGFENYHFFELENSETCNKEFLDLIKTIFRTPCFTIVIDGVDIGKKPIKDQLFKWVYGYANTYGLFHIICNMSLYRSFLIYDNPSNSDEKNCYEITVNEKSFKTSDFKTKSDGSIEFTADDGTIIRASDYEIRKLN